MKKFLAALAGLSLILTALSGCILGPRDEKQAFIDATVEATCYIFKSKNMFDPAVEAEAKAIYKKFGFPADDQKAMEDLANKYAQDEEVRTTITDKIKECSKGLPGLEALQNPSTEETLNENEVPGGELKEGENESGNAKNEETQPAKGNEETPPANPETPATGNGTESPL